MAITKEDALNAVAAAKKLSKRGFVQSVDLIVPLTGLDLKKPEHQVDFFAQLPRGSGKKM